MVMNSRPTKVMRLEDLIQLVPNWLELPKDVTSKILQLLGPVEIVKNARRVCPMWRNICRDPSMWKSIEMIKSRKSPYNLEKICMYAVDQGCDHVEEINVEYFATDELIKKIAERTTNLRRIRISKCLKISDKAFSDAAKKFSLLEELELSFNELNKDSLEAIGQNCPLLKTLKFNRAYKGLKCTSYKGFKCNKEAFAIAKMSGLKHLELWGNNLTSDGLVAILDGCPNLESLDLRMCYKLVMSEDLVKRCYENIKYFRHPGEFIDEHDDDKDDHVFVFHCECRDRSGKGMKRTKMTYMNFNKFR
ncbi:putative F-box/LRR-repeat protein 9 [Vicia villosa]|uniref:putative F-box/LRR-repeat protein 9 n=1 Tax=Vicia villosa TaxID=3911 RepID=UPI00273AB82F|nr:putative F-box/LRR-repeat protein 9 [Vicia villosa]